MPITKVTSRSDRKLQDVADSLHKAKKVVVFTGAGISTNSGIPVSSAAIAIFHLERKLTCRLQDFRSKDGLYSLIKADYDSQNPGSGKGRIMYRVLQSVIADTVTSPLGQRLIRFEHLERLRYDLDLL